MLELARLARRDEHEQILHPVVNPKSAQGERNGSLAGGLREIGEPPIPGERKWRASGDFAWSVIDRAIKG